MVRRRRNSRQSVVLLCLYLWRVTESFPLPVWGVKTPPQPPSLLLRAARREATSRWWWLFRGGSSSSMRLVTNPTTETTTTTTTAEPVHVIAEHDDTEDAADKEAASKTIQVHQYQDPRSSNSKLYWSLNTSLDKFHTYLKHQGVKVATEFLSTRTVDVSSDADSNALDAQRLQWRSAWKDHRLVTDRTELLTIYPSETGKRGGFADLLSLYCDRIYNVLVDEQEDFILTRQQPQQFPHAPGLVGWLQRSYGMNQTQALQYETFSQLNASRQLEHLKHFLEWFRSEFPYFYDRCSHCGSSYKESKDTSSDDEHKTFVGYIYPDPSELAGKASRTELFECHKCHQFTRFPRYNSAAHVISHHRGRCGEYSMLVFRLLRALGHDTRWVVDWADHVWAEVRFGKEKWVHLDPCEAAVDENHLYQGWGKKQTFVLGFYLPSTDAMNSLYYKYPLIEDITLDYTSDSWSDICKRRDEPEEHIRSSIKKAMVELRRRLQQQQRQHYRQPTR